MTYFFISLHSEVSKYWMKMNEYFEVKYNLFIKFQMIRDFINSGE